MWPDVAQKFCVTCDIIQHVCVTQEKDVCTIIMTSAVATPPRTRQSLFLAPPKYEHATARKYSRQSPEKEKNKRQQGGRSIYFGCKSGRNVFSPLPEYVGILDIRWNRMDVLPVAFNVNVFILFNNHACFFTIPSSTAITIDTLILCTTISTHTETRQQGSKQLSGCEYGYKSNP